MKKQSRCLKNSVLVSNFSKSICVQHQCDATDKGPGQLFLFSYYPQESIIMTNNMYRNNILKKLHLSATLMTNQNHCNHPRTCNNFYVVVSHWLKLWGTWQSVNKKFCLSFSYSAAKLKGACFVLTLWSHWKHLWTVTSWQSAYLTLKGQSGSRRHCLATFLLL